MKTTQNKPISPYLQSVATRLVQLGLGEVVYAPDGHIFFSPCVAIKEIWGALDVKKEGALAGERVVIRRVRKRAKNSKYAGMPMFQLYSLPIVKKDASTMTESERRNMELNIRAMRMAHAVENDPERAPYYHELHEAHKKNPEGYKQLYPTFFGFLEATFRMQLAAQEAEKEPVMSTELTEPTENHIRLCVPRIQRLPLRSIERRAFRPFVRLPMVA